MDLKTIEEILKSHNIKPSHHRLRVLEYLLLHRNHPTVEMIYQHLLQDIPTLSKTTLYNTLNLFVERGIVIVITIEENENRYDADISLHGHLKCNHCGQIFDIRLPVAILEFAGLEKFEITESQMYFKGICPTCLKNRDGQMN